MKQQSVGIATIVFNAATTIIAIAGLLVALSANSKAEEANQIARQANQLTIISLNPHVQLKETVWSPAKYTSVNPLTGTYLTFNRMAMDLLVTNSGGATTSLVAVNGFVSETALWDTRIYTDSDFTEQATLPSDIPPGSSRIYYVAAFDLLSSGKSLDNMTPAKAVPYGEGASFYWRFLFGDGQTQTEIPIRAYSQSYTSPEEKCVLTNTFLP